MTEVMNPWGGRFVNYDRALLNDAGMSVVVDILDPTIFTTPSVDQRAIPDVDRNEACGEAALAAAAATAAHRIPNADLIIDWMRAKYGEGGVQYGTSMYELDAWLTWAGIHHRVREAKVGDAFVAAEAAQHCCIGAVWTAYTTVERLDPKVGGKIGHWMLGGHLHPPAQAGGTLVAPILGGDIGPRNDSAWMVAGDGGVFTSGPIPFYGSMGGKPLVKPIVALRARPQGDGYWMVASDGGIFCFGNARFFGSMGGKPLNQPICGMSPTKSGDGYCLFAGDGGTFNFGDSAVGSLVGKI